MSESGQSQRMGERRGKKGGGGGSNQLLEQLSADEIVAMTEELQPQTEGAEGREKVEAEDGPRTETTLTKNGAGAAQENVGNDEETYQENKDDEVEGEGGRMIGGCENN